MRMLKLYIPENCYFKKNINEKTLFLDNILYNKVFICTNYVNENNLTKTEQK